MSHPDTPLDILFVSVPVTDTPEPIMAPGYLKAVAESAGFRSRGIDLNGELYRSILEHPKVSLLTDFFYHNRLHTDAIGDIAQLIDHAADRILSYRPRIVGLSLLTMYGQVFTYWLCVRLKSIAPHMQIWIGGTGIRHALVTSKNQFCDDLLKRGLIDHYISGDGEQALIELLNGRVDYPGIDTIHWQELKNIDSWPDPDYDDYDFSIYDYPALPLTDSRGCVRACEFCDLIEHWKKFVYRPADSVFGEMLRQIEKYGIRSFHFRNSLTNGNMKDFQRLMEMVAKYNQGKSKDQQISWKGYFIIRSQQQHPQSLWEIMSMTNPWLLLGVESVVHHVRWNLGKKFHNEDIDYHLEMAKRYRVLLSLLLIVGYPTETREDYEFTKQWFRDRISLYGNNDPVRRCKLSPATILDNTALERKADQLQIVQSTYSINWMSKETGITPSERAQYLRELSDIAEPFGVYRSPLDELHKDITEIALQGVH